MIDSSDFRTKGMPLNREAGDMPALGFAVVDGRVVTGQNSASSTAAAKALIELVAARKAA